MPYGVYRRVFLMGRFAIKIPRLRRIVSGLRSNRWEREMWYRWRPIFGWTNLCPIILADPFGFVVVVMSRACRPVTMEEIIESDPDDYPDITSEMKPADFGRIGNLIVALDYGLTDADNISARRAYLLERSLTH